MTDRQKLLEISRQRKAEFEALAKSATSEHWRLFWLEAVEFHETAIRQLEAAQNRQADELVKSYTKVVQDDNR